MALRERRPAALLPAERLGLGRRPLARHRDVSGPLGHRRPGHPNAPLDPNKVQAPFDADKLVDRALGFWGDPQLSAGTRRVLRSYTRRVAPDGQPNWKQAELPGARRELAPSADRRLPGPADVMSRCCNEFTRSSLLRRAVAEAGVRAACDRAGDADAGRHRPRPSRPLLRSAGLTLAVYGAGSFALPGFETGILEAASAAPAQPVLVSVFLDGGTDSLSLLAPVGDPDYRRLRREAGPAGLGARVHRGSRAALASRGRRAPDTPSRGQAHRPPDRRLHRRGSVPLHVAPLLGGRRDESGAPHRLDGAVSRPGRTGGQSAAGSQPRRRARAAARDPQGSSCGAARRRLLSVRASGVWGEVERRCSRRSGRSAGRAARATRPSPRSPASRRTRSGSAQQLAPFNGTGITSPVPYPKHRSSFPSPARRSRGDARRRPPAPLRRAARLRDVRHARRPGGTARPGTEAHR